MEATTSKQPNQFLLLVPQFSFSVELLSFGSKITRAVCSICHLRWLLSAFSQLTATLTLDLIGSVLPKYHATIHAHSAAVASLVAQHVCQAESWYQELASVQLVKLI